MSNTINSGLRTTLLKMESELTQHLELAKGSGHQELVRRLRPALSEVQQLLTHHQAAH